MAARSPLMHAAWRWVAAFAFAGSANLAEARQGEPPLTLTDNAKVGIDIPLETVRGVDAGARRTALDRETLDLVKRAQPFAAPPAAMAGEVVFLVVPIRFNIH